MKMMKIAPRDDRANTSETRAGGQLAAPDWRFQFQLLLEMRHGCERAEPSGQGKSTNFHQAKIITLVSSTMIARQNVENLAPLHLISALTLMRALCRFGLRWLPSRMMRLAGWPTD